MKPLFIVVLFAFFAWIPVVASESMPGDSLFVTLNEINITAVKQTESMQEESEASTVLSAKEIEQLGIVTMRGISDVVPNFYMPDYGSRITSTIYVRGLGSRMDQPSVGLNVDNVPYLNKDAYDFDISDISAVVMLRGPQSTLYGRNTMGGVINITTLSPLAFQGWRAFIELGNGGRIRANAGWYHKFSNKAALSVNGDYAHLSGFFRNEYNGEKTDKENIISLRSKFQYNPSEKFKIQNIAGANFLRQGGYPYEYLGTGKIEYNDTCFYRRFTFTDGVTVGWDQEKFNMTSITSVQHIDDNMTLDQDFLPESYFTLTQKKKETNFTEELVFKGREFSERYNWITGGMFFYKHLYMDAPVTFKDVGIRELIENHRNDANPNYPIQWDSRQFILNSRFTIPTFGLSAYHESELKAGHWNFTAGIRLDYEKTQLKYNSFCDTGYEIFHDIDGVLYPYGQVPIYIDDYGNIKKDFLTLLPKFAIMYFFDEEKINIYAKVTKGYKTGGFNTQMFSDVLQQRLMNIMGIGSSYNVDDIVTYKPEKSWNYEIGSHMFFAAIGLSMEITAFYIDCTDQQLTMFPDGTTTGRIMTNAGKTRSFGGEFSGNLQLNHFELNLSYGYTNARFREFFNGINDFAGKYLPYVPSNTFFAQGLYNLKLSNKKLSNLIFDLNVRGTGPIYWNEENDAKQNFYAQLGASVTWQYKNWEFKAWGKNLTDTYYHTFYFKSMGNEFLQRGRPLEAGFSVRFTI